MIIKAEGTERKRPVVTIIEPLEADPASQQESDDDQEPEDNPLASNADPLPTGDEPAAPLEEDDGEEQLHVAFGSDPSPGSEETDDAPVEIDGVKQAAPPWVKELRKSERETKQRLRELEAENAKLKQPAPEQQPALITVGERPTFEQCGYDEAKFQSETDAWLDRKQKADAQQVELGKKQEEQKRKEQERTDAYAKEKLTLKAKDVQECEDRVTSDLSPQQQNMLVDACAKPALFVYALGRPENTALLKELSAISNPVKFIAAVVRKENELKTATTKGNKPRPESRIQGNVSTTTTTDKKLEQLRAEADKTGDMTEVVKYRREKKRLAAGK